MIIHALRYSKPLGFCLQSFKNVKIRQYQSLVTAINGAKRITHTLDDDPKLNESIKSLIRFNPLFRDLVEGHKVSRLKEKLDFLKSYMGPSYRLSDELLIISLYPQRELYVEIDIDPQTKSLMYSSSIELLGFNLYKLERSLGLINKTRDEYEFETDVLSSQLSKVYLKKSLLNHVSREQRLFNLPFISSKHKGPHGQVVATTQFIYLLIGLISLRHGKKKASKFIKESIINGRGGLFDKALERL